MRLLGVEHCRQRGLQGRDLEVRASRFQASKEAWCLEPLQGLDQRKDMI